jgi:hypothetical protein
MRASLWAAAVLALTAVCSGDSVEDLLAASRAARAETAAVLGKPVSAASRTAPRTRVVPLTPDMFQGASFIERMYLLPGFLTKEEVVELSKLPSNRSAVIDDRTSFFEAGETGEGSAAQGDGHGLRVSRSMFVHPSTEAHTPWLARLLGRLHSVANVPLENGEQLQITEYSSARKARYIPHMDSILPMGRSATFLVYLNTLRPGDGGTTVFPDARISDHGAKVLNLVRSSELQRLGLESDEEFLERSGRLHGAPSSTHRTKRPHGKLDELDQACEADTLEAWVRRQSEGRRSGWAGARLGDQLRIRPLEGMAVLWFNHDLQNMVDPAVRHAACELEPANAGDIPATGDIPPRHPKMIAQRWLTWYPVGLTMGYEEGPLVNSTRGLEGENTFDSLLRECLNLASLRRIGLPPVTAKDSFFERAWTASREEDNHLYRGL